MFEEKQFKDWHFDTSGGIPVTDNTLVPKAFPDLAFESVKNMTFEEFRNHDKTGGLGEIIGPAILVSSQATGPEGFECWYGYGTKAKSHQDLRSSCMGSDFRYDRCYGFVTNKGIFLTRKQARFVYEDMMYDKYTDEQQEAANELAKGLGSELYSYNVEWEILQSFIEQRYAACAAK